MYSTNVTVSINVIRNTNSKAQLSAAIATKNSEPPNSMHIGDLYFRFEHACAVSSPRAVHTAITIANPLNPYLLNDNNADVVFIFIIDC